MMRVSDIIAGFIGDMLDELGGSAEIRRSDLAHRFNCVPSQINYVISTRFSPEHGYIVESRRGGGGYIRITRVEMEPEFLIMHTVNAVGDVLDLPTATALTGNLLRNGAIRESEARLILSAIGNNSMRPIHPSQRDILRASVFKQMLTRI